MTAVSSGSAHSRLNGAAQNLLFEHSQEAGMLSSADNSSAERINVLVLMRHGYTPDSLADHGQQVNWYDGEIASVTLPVDRLEMLADDDAVEFVEYNPDLRPMLNFAREDSYVNDVHQGVESAGAKIQFTGKGILTGLMDSGLDPNHINFKNAEGESRVKTMIYYPQSSGIPEIYSTPREIRRFQSDNSNETHGTHVAGIMAGSYNGTGKYGWISSDNGSNVFVMDGDIPYYGVATGSDIAMAGGPLSQNNIANAISTIFDLAETSGQPCVVNLSLGNTSGPHDGTDLFCRSIATQAKRGVVVISAGNDGEEPMYLTKEFTGSDNVLKTFLKSNAASGSAEIWGSNATPFKVTIALYANAGSVVTDVCTVSSAGQTASSSNSTLFSTYYSGTVTMTSGINPLNNRFNVAINFSARQLKSGQNIAIIIEGSNGQSVYVYGTPSSTTSEGILFTNNRISGWADGACNGSLNSLACANGVISVGAYTSRITWPLLSGQCYMYTDANFIPGDIAPFSSWGHKFGGGWLPDVCAPGANIISSYNTYYVRSANTMSAQASNGSKTNYWGPMQGTSMSSPFVAGVVALWLEANPTLTTADILNIMQETSINPADGALLLPGQTIKNPERWGAGKIDALAGIKKVLDEKASVGTIFADDERNFILTPVDGGYNVYVAGESQLTVTIYDAAGRSVSATSSDGNSVDVDTSSLRQGVYILSAKGNTQLHNAKIAVK
ncbi:MAG: S8 family peptidase [Muribaculaceae bacterium]|nr:S8 family peptidase [Muribaculaceae bacterium]